jgi:hypothetical protein
MSTLNQEPGDGKPRRQAKTSAAKRRNVKNMDRDAVELDLPRIAQLINSILTTLETGGAKGKASVGDLLRLMQAYQELSAEQIKEVEVRWVSERGMESDFET